MKIIQNYKYKIHIIVKGLKKRLKKKKTQNILYIIFLNI